MTLQPMRLPVAACSVDGSLGSSGLTSIQSAASVAPPAKPAARATACAAAASARQMNSRWSHGLGMHLPAKPGLATKSLAAVTVPRPVVEWPRSIEGSSWGKQQFVCRIEAAVQRWPGRPMWLAMPGQSVCVCVCVCLSLCLHYLCVCVCVSHHGGANRVVRSTVA